jgi:hypothetical protein
LDLCIAPAPRKMLQHRRPCVGQPCAQGWPGNFARISRWPCGTSGRPGRPQSPSELPRSRPAQECAQTAHPCRCACRASFGRRRRSRGRRRSPGGRAGYKRGDSHEEEQIYRPADHVCGFRSTFRRPAACASVNPSTHPI